LYSGHNGGELIDELYTTSRTTCPTPSCQSSTRTLRPH
jgi:hypothetical protein